MHLDIPSRGPMFKIGPPPMFTLHADRSLLFLAVLFAIAIGVWVVGMTRRDVDESGR